MFAHSLQKQAKFSKSPIPRSCLKLSDDESTLHKEVVKPDPLCHDLIGAALAAWGVAGEW